MQLDSHAQARTASAATLIAETRSLIREGIKTFVSAMVGRSEFLEAYDGASLLRAAARMPGVRTQLAFVSLKIPGLHADMVLAEMAARYPRIPIIVIESSASEDVIRRAMNVPSVYACVSSDADAQTMRAAIQAALDRRKMPRSSRSSNGSEQVSTLTPRQNQIHELLRRGMSNKMIASELSISEGTVKNHMTVIFKTLNATNRTQAAQFTSGTDIR